MILREGLAIVLSKLSDLKIVGMAADDREILRLVAEVKPDVVIIDSSIQINSFIDLFRQLSVAFHEAKVLVLAKEQEEFPNIEAFKQGVCGIVIREAGTEMLAKAIRGICENKYWNLDHEVGALEELDRFDSSAALTRFGLTPREIEIIAAIVSGNSNRQIAKKMSISMSTTKHHLSNIFDKLGVFNRLELVLFAVHNALTDKQIASNEAFCLERCADQSY